MQNVLACIRTLIPKKQTNKQTSEGIKKKKMVQEKRLALLLYHSPLD